MEEQKTALRLNSVFSEGSFNYRLRQPDVHAFALFDVFVCLLENRLEFDSFLASLVEALQIFFCELLMLFHLVGIHLSSHGAHHRPAWILCQFLAMLIDPSPVQSVPDVTPSPFAVMAHFPDIGGA